MSQNLRTYLHACYGLDATIRRVPAGAWGRPTPCEAWSAAEIVGHLLLGHNRILTTLGAGQDLGGSTESQIAGDDPAAAWEASFAKLRTALDAQGSLRVVGPTPFGEMTIDQFVGAVYLDPLAHTWDLAVATGVVPILDEGLSAHGLAQLEVVGELVRDSGMFGPVAEVQPGSSTIDRFIAATGRNPAWRPNDRAVAAQAWLDADAHAQQLGVELVSATDDEVVVALQVREEHCNSMGALHGGVSFSLADIGLSTVCNLPDPTAVAIDVHMVFLSACRLGQRVQARCSTVRRGRSLGTYRADLEAEGRAIGAFTGTVMVTSD